MPLDNQVTSAPVITAPYHVDASRGGHNGRVSSEWFTRPADQRYLNLSDLYASVRGRADSSRTAVIEAKALRVHADREDSAALTLSRIDEKGRESAPIAPTHWSFGQLCALTGTPAGYLRDKLPGVLAASCLQWDLLHNRGASELVKTYVTTDGRTELRAATGPDYGRIFDHELVAAVQRIAGDGTGRDGYRWKIPGVLDWHSHLYNPEAEVTRESTTLYASDRDVFLFLVDDRNPIEAGKLPNGDPDLYFRGFYAWNSEVGSKTLGIATFYLRAVCQNRNLWGVEEFSELKIRHTKFAADKFAREAAPALLSYAESSSAPFVQTIKAARDAIVAKSDDERMDFLRGRKFSKSDASAIMAAVLNEEGRAPESVYDFVQGITAVARGKTYQDERLGMEKAASDLLAKV